MSVAGTAAITEMWAKCKAWFGRKLGASTTATTISIHLKNNAGDVLETATISAATTTDAGPMSADDKTKLNGIATGATANAATTTTPKMDGTAAVGTETAYAKGDHVHPTDTSRQATLVSGTNIKTIGSQSILGSGNLTPANIGAAATSHSHGNITSGGDITASAPTIASGDRIVINDDSASKITNGPAFGTSTTTFLANNGTWQTPAGTTTDFTSPTESAAGTHGLVPAPPALTTDGAQILTGKGWYMSSGVWVETGETSVSIFDDIGDYNLSGGTISAASQTAAGVMTKADKIKLDGITAGAQPNQNAFSNVKVGSTTVAADAATDTLELVAGSNVTLTPDATNDKVTIAATNTTYSDFTGATASAAGAHGLVPAPASGEQNAVLFGDGDFGILKIEAWAGTIGTATNKLWVSLKKGDNRFWNYAVPVATSTVDGAMSKDDKSKLDALPNNATLSSTYATKSELEAAQVGAATFKGTLVTNGTPSNNTWDEADIEAASYKKGWYWVCQTAGTYTGKVLEVGDMLFCVNNKGNAYAASDFTAVQNNLIEMTTDEVDAICV